MAFAWTAGFFLVFALKSQLMHGERVHLHGLLEAHDEVLGTKDDAETAALSYWSLFGETGPNMSDVAQGQLGDCYYLASLAAIAREHPEVIEEVFVNRGTTAKQSGLKVYQLRFFVDGIETVVALDEIVPMACRRSQHSNSGGFFFACSRDNQTVWPILLEKGFAKVFGSYLSIRSGFGYDGFKAITQAPVDFYEADYPDGNDQQVWEDPDILWDAMSEALKEKYPMTAGSVENSFGTVAGHEFAVIGLGSDPVHGKTVEVYNPWAENNYSGKLEALNKKSKGDYFLTFEEFTQAFNLVWVARVRKGYSVHSIRVPVGKPVALRFTVQGSDPLAVQLEWPTKRFFNVHGCPFRSNTMQLLVALVGEEGWWHAGRTHDSFISNLRVDLQDPGEYLVYVFGSFDGAPWAEEMVVNAYANEVIVFEKLEDPLAMGRQILGFPCRDVKLPIDFFYKALPYPVGGGPAWQLETTLGEPWVIWLNAARGRLSLAPSEDLLNESFPEFDASEVECAEDLPRTATGKERTKPGTIKQVETSCDFVVGERVSYNHGGNWICSEVEVIHKDSVDIRYLLVGSERLGCQSEKLKKVTQCRFHEEDRIRYKDDVAGWLDEQIMEVDCGTVTLSSGKVVRCDAGLLEYPQGCPFYEDEKVLVWSRSMEKWTFATVAGVKDDKVEVRYPGVGAGYSLKEVDCKDQRKLKKLSRCDKRSHEQISRFRDLDNFRELAEGHEDSLFRPSIESIGPAGADCGDAAKGGEPEPCEKFNSWNPISNLLP